VAALEGEFGSPTFQTFIKAEAYGKPKPGRIITPVPGLKKMEYSRFTYSLSEELILKEFIAIGKDPVEMSQRVVDIAQQSKRLIATDFNKMDGRTSPAARYVMRSVLLRFFNPVYHEEIIKLFESLYNKKARTRHGFKYDTGYAQSSGSPDTAIANTIINAFTNFYALIIDGNEPNEAYAMLGIYLGDDGLTGNLAGDSFVKAAAYIGQLGTKDEYNRGDAGVNFLSRFYTPSVWYGNPNSCSDIGRFMLGFHMTPNLPAGVTPEMKLVEKSRSAALSDHDTPVKGLIALKVLELIGENVRQIDISNDLGLRSYHSLTTYDRQWPNEYDPYFDTLVPTDFDLCRFTKCVENAKSLHDLLTLPLCIEPSLPDVDEPFTVGNEVVFPKPPPKAKEGRRSAPKTRGRGKNKGVKA
jgi:hypothetical protein